MPGGKKWDLNKQLADSAITGTAENIKELLDAGADPDAPDGFYGLTALMKVAQQGYIDKAKLLLDYGADPNIPDNGGGTALIHAVRYGQTEMVKLLIGRGADKDAVNKEGHTLLITVCRDPKKIYQVNRREVIATLIALGASLDNTDKYGNTALIHLALEGYTGIMKLLIEHGADPDIRNKTGMTALDILKACYSDKYKRWMQDTAMKARKQILKKEDSAKSSYTGYEFDI